MDEPEMKRIIVRYGCGYGSHETDFDIEASATEGEIEKEAEICALQRYEWSWRAAEDAQ